MTEGGAGSARLKFPSLLRQFWVAVVVLTLFSALYSFIMIDVVHAGYPYNIAYFYPHTKQLFHWDFTVFTDRFVYFRKPDFWDDTRFYPFTYPAATAIVFAVFYKLPHAVWCYVGLCLIALAIGCWCLAAQLAKRGVSLWLAAAFVLTLAITSWPMMFLLQRANIEGIVVMLTAAGMLAAMKRRWWLAATLFGIAGAMKIFPLILLGLPLAQRRYREFAWGLVTAALATLASLAILGPSVLEAQRHIAAGLLYFQQAWAAKTNVREFFFDHSLFALLKMPVIGVYHGLAAGPVMVELRLYTALSAIAGIALYFLVIRKMPVLNQLLALGICAVLLPPVSMDYTLPHLFVPFGMLCLYAAEQWRQGKAPSFWLQVCFGMFALIFTDLQFANLFIRLSGQVRAVALVVLLIAVLRFRMPWNELDGETLQRSGSRAAANATASM